MATGALTASPRRTPGQNALTTSGALPSQDQARIAALLQAAAQANRAGNTDRLKKVLEEILEIDPDHATALYNLGI
jgi:hypothetical protein